MTNSEFLSLLEVPKHSGRFVLGPFDPGITLLRQQTRALNLIYALSEAGRLPPGAKLAVIGGGVAGVTAAAAAATLGCKVSLIERLHALVHLQQGCDTRWLHPHIYDWPRPGAQREYAGLPLLDWYASSASAVARQIVGAFQRIQQACGIGVYFGSELKAISNSRSRVIKVRWVSQRPDKKMDREVDVVVFAVGFGVERNVNHHWPSYWRNDSIHQANPLLAPRDRTSLLISGTGDGGLIDLMRTTITDFSQASIHQELFASSSQALFGQLNAIKARWRDGEGDNDASWLYRRYDELEQDGLLNPVMEALKLRARPDTQVALNGRVAEFQDALGLDSASMFSTLIAFCQFMAGRFDYLPGVLAVDGDRVLIDGAPVRHEQTILRHGADTLGTYRAALCERAVDIIASPDRIRQYFNTAERLWPAGWWDQSSHGAEPVSPSTVALATTFVSTLRDMVQLVLPATAFRMTMHRLLEVKGGFFYQQIARYAGGQRQLDGAVGRVFDVNLGLGGLCCRVGKPVVLKKGAGFQDLEGRLGLALTPARPIDSDTASFLAVPFFARDPAAPPDRQALVLLLYVDSNADDFFSDSVLRAIYTACKGFVGNIEEMARHGEIALASAGFPHFHAHPGPADRALLRDFSDILLTDHRIFADYINDLTFASLRFFEISWYRGGHHAAT